MIAAEVNDEYIPIDYILKNGYELQNKDIVRIITNKLSLGPNDEWLKRIKTTEAKRRIREFNKNERR